MGQLTKKQTSIITGSMLGDGSLIKRYSYNQSAFREGHSPKQYDYLCWKYQQLENHCVSLKLEKRNSKPPGSKIVKPSECWVLRTHNDKIFSELEKKWYARDENEQYILNKNGHRIKIVPNDLILDELSICVWFLDDGTNLPKGRNAVFHSLSFSLDECNFLVDQIKKNGLKNCHTRNSKKGNEIVIRSASYKDFLEMMNVHMPCENMRYKADLSMFKEPEYLQKLSKEQIVEIGKLANVGMKQIQIAKMYDISTATISNILSGKRWSEFTGIEETNVSFSNTSGESGIGFHKLSGKWMLRIRGKYHGLFKTFEEAVLAKTNLMILYR